MEWCVGLGQFRGKAIVIFSVGGWNTRAEECFAFVLPSDLSRATGFVTSTRKLSLSVCSLGCVRGQLHAHMKYERQGKVGGEARVTIPRTQSHTCNARQYRTAVPHGRAVRVQPCGAGPPYRHQPNSGPSAGCTTQVGGAPTSGGGAPFTPPVACHAKSASRSGLRS